ncbi:Uma2 family endonuclease [Sphaerospermopsis sp. LEGE 08334]|uniref:Uma2 family endonuclease n=1 Tax=Sphaerospermopsis sp. LEGE 08334 TaxID=1828651 RepID=UPI001880B082|nr:Uma2 family endonuclease [Sphaerospermopsis sp. LEGE 08334]MBE9058274.1 Uma2 family endonuclease [Sphaerospermopsis sp. LEGE 08334]
MTQITTTNIELIQPSANNQTLTDEQFMLLKEDGNLYEYVDGELIIVANSGLEHGYLALTLGYFLTGFVREHKLGITCDSSTAFKMKNGNKRSPDLAFIDKARLQGLKRLPKGFFDGAPDLAVEIISPNNTFEEIHNKLVEYFENGTRLAWVILPDEECVLVYRKPKPSQLLQLEDSLNGEDVIPNFHLPLTDLFQELSF